MKMKLPNLSFDNRVRLGPFVNNECQIFVRMPKKRKRCTDPALYCNACTFLDSIGGIGNDGASRQIRYKAKKAGKNVTCTGHRAVAAAVPSALPFHHSVWTCASSYRDKSWDGLREDCHVLERHQRTLKVCHLP